MSLTYPTTHTTRLRDQEDLSLLIFFQHVRQQNYKLSQKYVQRAQDHGHVTQVYRHINSNVVYISGQHAQVSGTVHID